MKTIELTGNEKEIIIRYKDNTEKVIKNEETIYVPECIGLWNERILLFNNNKSWIYAKYGLYNVANFYTPCENQNNGKNFELVKCMFNEVKVGEIFVNAGNINRRGDLSNYDIKISEKERAWIRGCQTFISKFKNTEVYKVVKI